jgi:hypothetical protein
MYHETDIRVRGYVVHFLGYGIRGHDDDGPGRVRCRREVGVVHKAKMGFVARNGCEVKLIKDCQFEERGPRQVHHG